MFYFDKIRTYVLKSRTSVLILIFPELDKGDIFRHHISVRFDRLFDLLT